MQPILSVPFEVKALSDGQFEGHGSTFGNVDLGGDVVMSGAFKASLAEHKTAGTQPQMFWMHRPDQVPGAWISMAEDAKGLAVKGQLADTQLGQEMRTLLKMKAVRGLSIGFRTVDSEFTDEGIRLLKQVDLWEVSLVSLAMNPLAKIEATKARLSEAGEYVPSEREFEKVLRDAGLSRKVALHVCAKIFDDEPGRGMLSRFAQRDAGTVENDEAAEVLKAIEGLTDRIGADALRTRN